MVARLCLSSPFIQGLEPTLYVSNMGCWQWEGTTTWTQVSPTGITHLYEINVTWQRVIIHPDSYLPTVLRPLSATGSSSSNALARAALRKAAASGFGLSACSGRSLSMTRPSRQAAPSRPRSATARRARRRALGRCPSGVAVLFSSSLYATLRRAKRLCFIRVKKF